jgi:hypothetical protein
MFPPLIHCIFLLCSLVSMKKKRTRASFLFTSDDRPTGREGARSNFEPQHRQVSTHHHQLPSPNLSGLYLWSAGDSARAGASSRPTSWPRSQGLPIWCINDDCNLCVILHLKRHACVIICVQSNFLYDLPTHLQAWRRTSRQKYISFS